MSAGEHRGGDTATGTSRRDIVAGASSHWLLDFGLRLTGTIASLVRPHEIEVNRQSQRDDEQTEQRL